MHKTACYIAEDQRIVILAELVRNDRVITAGYRIKLIRSDIRDSAGEIEEESLGGDHINSVHSIQTIHIRRREPASGKRNSKVEKMSLDCNDIDSVNADSARGKSRFTGRHCI